MQDDLFSQKIKKQFEFDESVASVFDDMLNRSIPFYKEVLDLCVKLVIKNSKNGDGVFDIGCSTASTLLEIYKQSPHKLRLVGIDNSTAMVDRARKKADFFGADIELVCGDALECNLPKSNIFISNYTLQFIRPIKREEFVEKVFLSLKDDGVFIFSEKIICEDKKLSYDLVDIYYDFKKSQGYSEYEIMQKREALENVLVPYSDNENKLMIKKAGFKECETIFRWANFATYIAFK
jgi:tRNA (cmo5U34)-methyltransferase